MSDCEVDPSDLKFRFQLNKQLLATITIKNNNDKRVAFKIKTTAPKKYVVRPSSGIVEAKSQTSVQVIMQAQKEYPADFQNCKDKFMVQTTLLDDSEQLDRDTFLKDGRKDTKEYRLKVIMEGPAAPPSPVPEANENEEDARALGDGDNTRLRTTLNDLSHVSTENSSLKSTVDRLTKERDDLRRQLDMIQLQTASKKSTSAPAAGTQEAAMRFKVTIVHIILVALVAFLLGHYL